MNKKQIQERLKASFAEARAIIDAAKESADGLTEEQEAKLDELSTEQEKLERQLNQLKKIEDTEERTARFEQLVGTPLENTPPGRDEPVENRWNDLGEFCTAAMRASRGGDLDPRLVEQRATGMGETIDSEGGFLIPDEFSNAILQEAHQTGLIASRCRLQPMSSRRLKIPAINETSRADGSRAGGIRAYWTGEAVATTTSKPGFGMVEFNAHKLTVAVYITEELQEDRAALGPFVQTLAAQELAFKLDDAIVNGDGSGKPLGLLNAPATISVAKESGQTADTVNYANVRKMRARVFSGSRAGYVWLINQEVESQLEQMLLSGSLSDIAVYMPANGISQAPFATLYGRPLIMVEQAPKLGDKGDINAVDLSRYILARHTSGVQTAASIHVKFLEGEPVFRIRMRVDGQPWWKSALTKYKGNDTVSPYVTLAERA